jgi:hypothetical protein
MSEHEVRDLSSKSGATAKPYFGVNCKNIRNPHKFQFYVDYGSSNAGPWIVVVVNDVEYSAGYSPHEYSQAETHTSYHADEGRQSSFDTTLSAVIKTFT